MEEEKDITLRFESGTSPEELVQFANMIRAKLVGKMPDEQIEALVQSYLANIINVKLVCDCCRKEIEDDDLAKQNNKFSFKCKKCPMQYDMCYECQQDEGTTFCPEGFGCNPYGVSGSQDEIFITKVEKEPDNVYSAFGKLYRVTETKNINVGTDQIIKDYDNSVSSLRAVIYIKDKTVSHEFLRDLWLHFRSTDITSLEKYGAPSTVVDSLGSMEGYELHHILRPIFLDFISLDGKIDENSPLMLRFIYRNGDEFVIRRQHGEELEKFNFKFVTMFLPLSEYLKDGDNTGYNIEPFREQLESKANKTIEQMSEDGQILPVTLCIGKDEVK